MQMMKSHKTGLIAYGLDRQLGGIGRYTEELIAAFRDLGANPVILDAGGSTGDRQALPLRGGRLPALLTLGQVQIGWLARRMGLQLIHDPTGSMPLLLTSARRVVTIHDAVAYIYPETVANLTWLIYHVWLPLVAPYINVVITDSESSRCDILRFLPVKKDSVEVIPLAAHTRFHPLETQNIQPALRRYGVVPPYILYVGSLEARKNLPRLLEAFHRLLPEFPGWMLVIVGARKWKSTPIFDTVRRLQLEQHVHFTGFVAEEDLPALYNGADLFVFPSLYEGFGLPVLEAMACGTPVVTSNTSSLPEVAGDAALLINPLDVSAIADAVLRVLTEPGLADDLRERGLKRAAQFTWERTARETLAVYNQVLASAEPHHLNKKSLG